MSNYYVVYYFYVIRVSYLKVSQFFPFFHKTNKTADSDSESNSSTLSLVDSESSYQFDAKVEEELTNLIEQLKMAPELKADHLKMIPDFNGEVELLAEFISTSESLVNHFYNTTNPNDFQNIYLMSSLKSKIKGDAKINLSTYTINTWQDLKSALLNTYGDKRDCYTITLEMCNISQTNESAFEFHNKIQKYINLHSSYLDTHNMSGQTNVKEYVAKLGLRTLLRGLKEPLGSLMRTKNPKDLNEALNMLTNDFQIDSNRKVSPSNPKPSNSPRYIPPPMINRLNSQNQFNGPQQYQNRFNSFPNQNNRPFFQNQPSFQNRQKFSNNNNFYRPPFQQQQQNDNKNVWSRPTGHLPKPTPMSVNSRNTRNSLNNIEADAFNLGEEECSYYYDPQEQFQTQEPLPEQEQVNEQTDEGELSDINFCTRALTDQEP